MKIGVIGTGKMGEALIAGMLKSRKISRGQIRAAEALEDRAAYIRKRYRIACDGDSIAATKESDIIILAVKPFDVEHVLTQVRTELSVTKTLVSIAAGVRLETLSKFVPKESGLIRVMPNLACSVGEGMMAVCPAEKTDLQSVEKVVNLLSLTGRAVVVPEKFMDAITGLVGSGPAYVYLIIEALADAGLKLGLPRDLAFTLVGQTVLGAAKMVLVTGEHPAKLRDMVVTPGGTTIEGLIAMERGGIRAALIEAVVNASERAKHLASEK